MANSVSLWHSAKTMEMACFAIRPRHLHGQFRPKRQQALFQKIEIRSPILGVTTHHGRRLPRRHVPGRLKVQQWVDRPEGSSGSASAGRKLA
jgi:hypothetical protein